MKTKLVAIAGLLASTISLAQLKAVEYKDQSQVLSGFSGTPQKAVKGKPGILILPAWMGIDDHAKESAEQLQKMG
ncbi:MAG: dienelactone hydrolase family protein, partial [Flavobacterium stagni]